MASTINNTNALNTLKQSFKDIMTTYSLNGKTAKQLVDNSTYKRDLMAEALVAMADICSKALDMCNPNQDAPSILEDVVSKVKNAIVDIVPSIVREVMESNNLVKSVEAPIVDESKHVILVQDKNDSQQKFNNKSWADVASALNTKLKHIPVQKSLVTKEGQGCLIFPSKDDQEKAQAALQDEFKVSLTTSKKKPLLPKLKVLRINSSYKKEDKDVLKLAIVSKNSYIDALQKDGHTFEVLIIDDRNHYCVIKMSPSIRDAIMKRGTLYIDMESHEVKDHFHLTQCFKCQEYGHKKGESACTLKDSTNVVCLYCGENHESKGCPNKHDSSKWKCNNCAKSSNVHYQKNCKGHTTTSRDCPFVIQQTKALINRTDGMDAKNFFA